MPYAIDLKHDTAHKTWKRLSVVALTPDRLIDEVGQYLNQYAADNQMNADQVAARVVEITSSQIGSKKAEFVRVVFERESNASANRPRAPEKSLDELENDYLDAAAELRIKEVGLQNVAVEHQKFISIRDQIQDHPDFSGYLPETYYSGGDLDPVGAKPSRGERFSGSQI